MTVKVTPDTRLAVLDRVPFVISSAFLVGRVTPSAVECVLDGARVKVTHAAIRGDSPRVTTLPGFRRLEDFAREYLDISVIGRITPVTAIDWQRRLAGQYLAMTLPEGLTTDDLYPGLRELSPQKAAFHSYVLGSVPAPDEPGIAIEVAHERTSELKAEYGALLSDVVYRISNPALFDATVPESREFHLLLMQWDDAVSEATDEDLDALSRELTLAFSTARAHAERVGMDHLPWRARGTAEGDDGLAALGEPPVAGAWDRQEGGEGGRGRKGRRLGRGTGRGAGHRREAAARSRAALPSAPRRGAVDARRGAPVARAWAGPAEPVFWARWHRLPHPLTSAQCASRPRSAS